MHLTCCSRCPALGGCGGGIVADTPPPHPAGGAVADFVVATGAFIGLLAISAADFVVVVCGLKHNAGVLAAVMFWVRKDLPRKKALEPLAVAGDFRRLAGPDVPCHFAPVLSKLRETLSEVFVVAERRCANAGQAERAQQSPPSCDAETRNGGNLKKKTPQNVFTSL